MGWSAADIPNQQGRIALITGANSGLGLETARALKRCGATVVLACRSPRKAESAKQDLLQDRNGGAVDLVDLDLAGPDQRAKGGDHGWRALRLP
jgi:protochlorophyllide reductase